MSDYIRARAIRAFRGQASDGPFRLIAAGEVVDISKELYLAAAGANRAEKVDPKTPLGLSELKHERAKAAA